MTTSFTSHLLTGTHAARPAASAVPQGTIYSCTTHGYLEKSDGSATWSDYYGTVISGGSVSLSYGSNATYVGEIPLAGGSNAVARADHYHGGIGTVTASSSNTMQRGTVNLRAGTNTGFGLSDTDGDGEFDTITLTSVPGLSIGSNSMSVGATNTAGIDTAHYSPADHRHLGLHTVTSSASNTLQRPTVNFRAGANIGLAASDSDGDGTLDTVTIVGLGGASGGSALAVEEVDGSPTDAAVSKLIVPNGSLSIATHFATLNYAQRINGGMETIQAHGATGSTETFDLTNGNVHTATLDANCTFTLTGATNAVACSLTLILTQDGTGSRTVTWPGAVTWVGGVAPTLSPAAGAIDVITLITVDGGTNWIGASGGVFGGLTVKDEGSALATLGTILDFVGAGVVASGTGATKTITIAGAAAVANVDRKLYTGGDKTTTSTTFVDVDATNAAITMTTGAHRVRVVFNGTVTANAAVAVSFDIDIDGTRQGQTFGLAATNIKGNGIADVVCINYMSAALTAASHTFKLQWRTASNTATLYASTTVSPLHFSVEELQA